jgi:hypothetical protein
MATEENKPPRIGYKGENFDMLIVQGTTWGPHTMVLADDETGEPVNLTGTQHICEVRKTPDAAEVAAVAEITVIDGAAGEVQIAVQVGETSDIPADPDGEEEIDSTYHFDWRMKFPTGLVEPVAYGRVYVFRRVSQGEFA